MNIRNSILKYLYIPVVLIPVFFACVKQNLVNGNGVLKGKITIGPLCPVETNPPLPGCLPTKETYKAWATAVWTLDKKTKLATLDPNLDGTYLLTLPAGNYVIDFETTQSGRIGGSSLPAFITITDKDTTNQNISIDTGIR